MFENILKYWYLWLVLLLGIVLLVIVSRKASEASKKRRAIMEKELAELKREKALREKYALITPNLIENADTSELLDGISANIQSRIEKDDGKDMTAAFTELPQHEQYIYALKYLIEDSHLALSEFFKKNGEPLTSLAPKALEEIGCNLSPVVSAMYSMFDDNNEDVSIDKEEIKRLDEKFAETLDLEHLYFKIKEFVRANYK